jgi:hypothetical protein
MAKTKSKKKTPPKAKPLLKKVLRACTTITTIANAAASIHWIYQPAWPVVEPLFQSGLFCPESFWWDSLAKPVQRGESPTQIKSHLEQALQTLRTDQHIERRLAQYSDSDRQRISDAYDKILLAIHTQYPHLASSNVA